MTHTYTHTVLLHKDTYYTLHGHAHCCLGARPASSLNGHMQLFHGWTSLSLSLSLSLSGHSDDAQ